MKPQNDSQQDKKPRGNEYSADGGNPKVGTNGKNQTVGTKPSLNMDCMNVYLKGGNK